MAEETNKLAVGAETKHSFTLLAKFNVFRKKVQESKENEKRLNDQLRDLKEKLKLWNENTLFVLLRQQQCIILRQLQ